MEPREADAPRFGGFTLDAGHRGLDVLMSELLQANSTIGPSRRLLTEGAYTRGARRKDGPQQILGRGLLSRRGNEQLSATPRQKEPPGGLLALPPLSPRLDELAPLESGELLQADSTTGRRLSEEASPSPSPSVDEDDAGCLLTVVDGSKHCEITADGACITDGPGAYGLGHGHTARAVGLMPRP